MDPIQIKLTKGQKKLLEPVINKVKAIIARDEGRPVRDRTGVIAVAQLKVPDRSNRLKEPEFYVMPLTGLEAAKAYKVLLEAINAEVKKEEDHE